MQGSHSHHSACHINRSVAVLQRKEVALRLVMLCLSGANGVWIASASARCLFKAPKSSLWISTWIASGSGIGPQWRTARRRTNLCMPWRCLASSATTELIIIKLNRLISKPETLSVSQAAYYIQIGCHDIVYSSSQNVTGIEASSGFQLLLSWLYNVMTLY